MRINTMKKYFYIENNINNSKADFPIAAYSLDKELLGFVYYSISLKLWDYVIFNIHQQQYSSSTSFDIVCNNFLEDFKSNGFELLPVERAEKISSLI